MASFFGSLFGGDQADAANRAAADTYAKQLAASGTLRQAGDQYAQDYAKLGGNYDPYVQAGNSALQQLMAGLGLGGDQQAFTAAYRGLPGYQSGLETGTNAALRGVNASGMSNSGRALKALQRYGSDYEDQRVGSYLDRLTGLQGQGLQATGAQTGIQGQALTGRLNAYTGAGTQDFNSAGTIGQGQIAGEQARSSALQNLLGTAAYLGGSFIGGPIGGKIGSNLFGGSKPATLPNNGTTYSWTS